MFYKSFWYKDYIRTTDDESFVLKHFIKDFIFQHRLRYMVYFRIAQNTKNPVLKLFCEIKLYILCRKFGIEVKTNTKIGDGFVMIHPYNITISPYAVLGKNINIMILILTRIIVFHFLEYLTNVHIKKTDVLFNTV